MIQIEAIVKMTSELGGSDIHISEGSPLVIRVHGVLEEAPLQPGEDTKEVILSMLDEKKRAELEKGKDLDFAMQMTGGGRQRVNVFRQQGKLAATIRLLNSFIPSLESLKLPKIIETLADQPRGLILVTGPTGSGKSTTLAAMIDRVNHSRPEHILTIEDPIEYVYKPDKALIHQREAGEDVESFASALRSALREDPDVILVGEMRDYETISAALTAAETGHLVLSTLHTTGAAQTIDRIIDACPAAAQNQTRTQLSGILRGIVTQCLIPSPKNGGRVVATEILIGTDAVLNMIRENKCHQLNTIMQSGVANGMHTLNADLARLVNTGYISREEAVKYSNDRKDLEQYLD